MTFAQCNHEGGLRNIISSTGAAVQYVGIGRQGQGCVLEQEQWQLVRTHTKPEQAFQIFLRLMQA